MVSMDIPWETIGYFVAGCVILIAIEYITKDQNGKGWISKIWCLFNPVSCAINNAGQPKNANKK